MHNSLHTYTVSQNNLLWIFVNSCFLCLLQNSFVAIPSVMKMIKEGMDVQMPPSHFALYLNACGGSLGLGVIMYPV